MCLGHKKISRLKREIFLLVALQPPPDKSVAESKGVVRHRSTPTSVVKPKVYSYYRTPGLLGDIYLFIL